MRADDRTRVSLLVRVPPGVAFRAFTEDVDRWWRRGQRFRIAAQHGSVVHIEGGVGGRLFESFETSGRPGGATIVACGAITAWDPPHRFAFEWRAPNYAAGETTFVDVVFEVSPSGTLVTVTHSGWSALGDDHPVRHGESAAVFLRRMGRWWADQMTSLRLHLENER